MLAVTSNSRFASFVVRDRKGSCEEQFSSRHFAKFPFRHFPIVRRLVDEYLKEASWPVTGQWKVYQSGKNLNSNFPPFWIAHILTAMAAETSPLKVIIVLFYSEAHLLEVWERI